MQVELITLLATFVVVFIGAVLQAATGLGAGLLIVPFLALIDIQFVPGPVIFASLTLSFMMAFKDKSHISTQQLGVVFIGLAVGMVAGAIVLSKIALDHIGIVFGICILVAVLISAVVNNFQFTPFHKLIAGVVSGFMGTTAAIGAPVLALLYQFEDGKVIRATLGLIYFIASILMLMSLHLAGHFQYTDILLGMYLIPGFVLGYLFAGNVARFVDRGFARPAVLVISAISACVLIVNNL